MKDIDRQHLMARYISDFKDIMVFNSMSLEYPSYTKGLFMLRIKWLFYTAKWWIIFKFIGK